MLSFRSAFDLTPNRISLAASRARAGARPLLDLTESNPTRAGLPYDAAAMASPQSLAYAPEPFGIDAARHAVAQALSQGGAKVDARDVVLTASTSEAYGFLFKLLADPGDEVLVPRPSYPLFEHLARLESVQSVPYRLAYDGSWHIDLASVRQAITARTRAIVVVAPNNPTGSYLSRDELDFLGSLGLPIVSDEVFASYPLRPDRDGTRVTSAAQARGAPLVFVLGGLSKLAALPQMKLAWIITNGERAHVEAALSRLEVIADAFLSVATPVQHGVGTLLASRGTVERAIRARSQENLRRVRTETIHSAVSVLDVQAGWYATLRLPATRREEDWALTFLEEDAVYLHPGHFFDFEREAYAVVSLLAEPATFAEGIQRVVARVARG